MYSPIVRSVGLKRRNRTTFELLGNVFIHFDVALPANGGTVQRANVSDQRV